MADASGYDRGVIFFAVAGAPRARLKRCVPLPRRRFNTFFALLAREHRKRQSPQPSGAPNPHGKWDEKKVRRGTAGPWSAREVSLNLEAGMSGPDAVRGMYATRYNDFAPRPALAPRRMPTPREAYVAAELARVLGQVESTLYRLQLGCPWSGDLEVAEAVIEAGYWDPNVKIAGSVDRREVLLRRIDWARAAVLADPECFAGAVEIAQHELAELSAEIGWRLQSTEGRRMLEAAIAPNKVGRGNRAGSSEASRTNELCRFLDLPSVAQPERNLRRRRRDA